MKPIIDLERGKTEFGGLLSVSRGFRNALVYCGVVMGNVFSGASERPNKSIKELRGH